MTLASPSSTDGRAVYFPDRDRDYFRDPTKLYKHIERGNEKEALKLLEDSSVEAHQWVVRKATDDGSVTWRRLPIHEALIRNPSEALIIALIKAYPPGLKALDVCGRVPLHHACVHGASEAVVMKMVISYPESIDVKDTWGKTPLSIVASSCNPNKNQVHSLLSNGVGYFYRQIVGDEWAIKMEEEKEKEKVVLEALDAKWRLKEAAWIALLQEEKEKQDAHIKSLEEKWQHKIAAYDQSSKEYRCKLDVEWTLRMHDQTEQHEETLGDLEQISRRKEENWNKRMREEKTKQDLKLRSVFESWKAKVDEIDQSGQEVRHRMEAEIESLEKQVVNLMEEHRVIRNENRNLRDRVEKVTEYSQLISTLSSNLNLVIGNGDMGTDDYNKKLPEPEPNLTIEEDKLVEEDNSSRCTLD